MENCISFFTDRKVVIKFEEKDILFRPTDILKNRDGYKLMYQKVICQCKSFSVTFKSLEQMQYMTYGWLCQRNESVQ